MIISLIVIACKTNQSGNISTTNIKEIVKSSDVTLVDVRILSNTLQEQQKMPLISLWVSFKIILKLLKEKRLLFSAIKGYKQIRRWRS